MASTAAAAIPETTQDRALRKAAPDAAQEVVETTDTIMAGGMAIEPSIQAEVVGQLDDTLTTEERKEVSRSVFRIAWPAIAENALQTLLGIVDTAVVARLGTAAISGVGMSQQLVFVLTTALIAVSMGTTVLVARFTGSGQHGRASAVLKQSLILAAAASLVLMPIAFFSVPIMSMFGLDAVAAGDGATYFSITLLFSIFIVLMFVASAAMRGSGDTRTPMMVTGFINIINAVLAVEFVFGGARASSVLSEFLHVQVPSLAFIPAMGVAGSALAAVVARGVGTFTLLGLLMRPRAALSLWQGGTWRPSFDLIGRILKIGIPSAVEQGLMSVGILVYSLIVIGLGEVIFATSRLALNAVFLSQMPGFGFAVAATTLVGQSLGAKSPQRAWLSSWLSARSALIWMSAMGVVFFFFGDTILRVFTDDPQLLSLGGDALKVIAFNQPFLALAFVFAGALRGAGDVRFPMVITTIAVWIVRLPVGAFLGLPTVCVPGTEMCAPGLNLGLPGIYGALIVEAGVRAIAMYLRFRKGKWQQIKV